jgi:hypothetical protein
MCEVTNSPAAWANPGSEWQEIRGQHIQRFQLKDAKIVEHFAARDALGVFQQLGQLNAIVEKL